MSNDLENRIRAALRPVEPDEGFEDRVLARIASAASASADSAAPRSRWRRPQWLAGALAASLALVLLGGHLWQERQERAAGLAAREQLIEALRLTSEKLDLAYQGVNREPRPGDRAGDRPEDRENSGA